MDGRKIEVDLTLRRQFALQRDRLQAYFDTSIAIEDPLLIDSLSRRRTDRMQAITAITMNTSLMAQTRLPTIGVMALQIVGAM